MVFVWSHLCHGEPHFTLTQVALNDAIMIVAFAPIVGLLLGRNRLAPYPPVPTLGVASGERFGYLTAPLSVLSCS